MRVGLSDNLIATYALTAGDLGFPQGEGYTHSLVVYTTPAEDWTYVFQYDLVEVNANLLGPSTNHRSAFNNYLFYKISDGSRRAYGPNGSAPAVTRSTRSPPA